MPYIGRGPAKSGAFRILDDISGDFDGSDTTFALTVGSSALTVGLPETLIIAVDGVIQEPGSAFTISGSNIVFGSAPQDSATFWGVELGDVGGLADRAITQSAGNNSTKVATTAYVDTQVATEDTITELNDTTITSIASGEVLKWNGSAWINNTLAELGVLTVANPTFTGNLIVGSATVTEAQLEILDGATVTTTEVNLIDGGTARGTTALASGDGILINDGGTMRMTNVDTVKTFMATAQTPWTGNIDAGNYTLSNIGNPQQDFNDGTLTVANESTNPVLSVASYGAGSQPSLLYLQASRHATLGSHTPSDANDQLGVIQFQGSNGSAFVRTAQITGVANQDMDSYRGGRIEFSTVPDGSTASPTNRMTIENSGDVTVETGNVVMATSGKGIDFSARTPDESGAGSMSSEILDDYEEGTWTPGIAFNGGTTSVGYTTQRGGYTKIGDVIYASGEILLSAKGSSTGQAQITGLPFTVDTVYYGAVTMRLSNVSFADVPEALGIINSTYMALYETTNAGARTAIVETDFADNSSIFFSITYKVA